MRAKSTSNRESANAQNLEFSLGDSNGLFFFVSLLVLSVFLLSLLGTLWHGFKNRRNSVAFYENQSSFIGLLKTGRFNLKTDRFNLKFLKN
jgi:hypothetical protein